ncbi:hypothetical protein [Aquabacterium sp.]|uniref:hypothetical protein n=1 Tax=Aquabacterium sp. TaxID=1872578 RepID=UPI003D6D0D00
MFARISMIFLTMIMAFNVAMARQNNAPIYNPGPVALQRMDGQPSTIEQVRKAILTGTQPYGWKVLSDEPGVIKLEYRRPKSYVGAVVRVTYDAQSYQVHYVSSEGLFHEGEGANATIHPTYNSWMKYLTMRIMIPGELVPATAVSSSAVAGQ